MGEAVETMSIRVLIADDHEVVRSGLRSLFSGSEIDVVGEATNGEQAVTMARQTRPDVVLLDIRMPDGDGLRALDKIHAELPDLPVVMLSTYDNPTYIARAVTLGATDYVLKGSSRDELIATVKAAHDGDSASRSEQLQRVVGAMATKEVPPTEEGSALTQREVQVLRHVALGLSNKEIGRSLGISVETVKEHVQNILRKIQATDRTQAAVWAVRNELV